MRRIVFAVLALAASTAAGAQKPVPPAPTPTPTTIPAPRLAPPAPAVAASSFASEEVRFAGRFFEGQWGPGAAGTEGPARLRITYGQPHARGRRIIGGVVPLDSVWRLGANLATELEADVDVRIGGTVIPRGLYTLFVQPAAASGTWQLVVSKQNFQWGTDYDRTQDFARIPLRVRTRAEPLESLSIYLVPTLDAQGAPRTTPHGTLSIIWEKTELSTDWVFGR